jgi:hypothetical protein
MTSREERALRKRIRDQVALMNDQPERDRVKFYFR